MIFLGIDPGLSGAIVSLNEKGDLLAYSDAPTIATTKTRKALSPLSIGHLLIFEQGHGVAHGGCFAMIEQLGIRPKQSAQSGATQGKGWGYWIGALAALAIRYQVARPQEWQRAVLHGQPGEGKDRALLYAEARWPLLELRTPRGRVLDGRADAACIAEYARQLTLGGGR